MSRTPSAASSVAAQTTGHRKNPSLKASATAAEPPSVTFFITNLRLLDLDKRPDWPCITTQTFSTRDAQQNQKARIRCVEWALYRLFELWDAAEARDKLQPFFPPLEPLQSLNLRAALYRSLNELKKNGILGRDSILRKTMLDECKGDKLIEILILFSTAVLKRVVTAQKNEGKHAALSKRLATAASLSTMERESLLPLAIAHKASLTALLRRKAEHRARYNDLDRLLEEKGLQIAERTERIEARLQDNALHQHDNLDAVAIKKQLRDNWLGNTEWLNVVLHGDNKRAEEAFLKVPFVDIWSGISKGEHLTNPSSPIGLLEDLEARVKNQKHRLQRWQAFHAQIRTHENERQSYHGINLRDFKEPIIEFKRHKNIKLHNAQNVTFTTKQDTMMSTMSRRYHSDVFRMEEELSKAAKSKRQGGSGWGDRRPYDDKFVDSKRARSYKGSQLPQKASGRSAAGSNMGHEAVREPDCISNTPKQLGFLSKSIGNRKTATTAAPVVDIESRNLLSNGGKKPQEANANNQLNDMNESLRDLHTEQIPSSEHSASSSGERTVEDPKAGTTATFSPSVDEKPLDIKIASDTIGEPAPDVSVHPNSPSLSSCIPSHSPALPMPFEEEELLADQIISSVTNSTQSPVKKPRLSLMERTRMSMAHFIASGIPDPIDETSSDPDVPGVSASDFEPPDRHTSLVERTRQSMIRLSSQPTLHHQNRKHSRKSSTSHRNRTSLYPVNQFETPRMEVRAEEEEEKEEKKDPTPKEHLFAEGVKYASVFKSRPKVAMSPVLSPRREEGLSALAGVRDVEVDTGSGLVEESWEDSPLGGVRPKNRDKAPRL